jgi:acetylornithine/N-succinyldiaminopimelate aminotransferase
MFEKDSKYIFQTFARQPIAIARGRGTFVWDSEGRKYLDFVSGISVNIVGHCNPAVVSAIRKQSERFIHTSNLYYSEPQMELAEKLCRLARLDKVFFCNSGTEAVEAALKLAAKVTGKKEFVAAEGSFHGRTVGALSVTHEEKFRTPFQHVLMKDVKFVRYDDVDALRGAVSKDTAAVLIEPIQGESGVRIPSDGYLRSVREICDERNVLLILDEIQTAFGRTGRWFCKEYSGITPDIMALAKALGGGLPLGAMLAREGIAKSFTKGDHGSTFGGNPLACSAGLAMIGVVKKENLVGRSRQLGDYFVRKLGNINSSQIKEVRGRGLMVGIELNIKGDKVVDAMREKGVLINCTAGNVLRFLPPLIIKKEHVDRVTAMLETILEK